MTTRGFVFVSVISWSLLIAVGDLNAQEVNSDVKIPPPREVVINAPTVGGLFANQSGPATVTGQALQATATQAGSGTLTEDQAREQIGDFMVSLLMKAGSVSFGNLASEQAAGSERASTAGVRPVWVGSVPLAPSVVLRRGTRRSRASTRPR